MPDVGGDVGELANLRLIELHLTRMPRTRSGKQIYLDIEITFIESEPSSCRDLNHVHGGWAKYQVIFDGDSNYHMENIDASVADEGGDSIYPGDYY